MLRRTRVPFLAASALINGLALLILFPQTQRKPSTTAPSYLVAIVPTERSAAPPNVQRDLSVPRSSAKVAHRPPVREANAPAAAINERTIDSASPVPAQAQPAPSGDIDADLIDILTSAKSVTREVARQADPRERGATHRPAPGTVAHFGEQVSQAVRPACETAYAGAGLIAVLFLIADAKPGEGCRWGAGPVQ
jgi:hypothetical protein